MENTKIEWADSTISFITGCNHGCEYCYARRIAERFRPQKALCDPTREDGIIILDEPSRGVFKSGNERVSAYPFGFEPTYHRYRLKELDNKKLGETIFVCSMSDMFGEWVPEHIILEIFDECLKRKNHRYLFLTKNPARYLELGKAGKLPKEDNFWYGSTVTGPNVDYFFANGYNTFLSIEPVLEPFNGKLEAEETVLLTDWVIIGAETGNRSGKVKPKREWVEDIVNAFCESGKPVFMKDSMKEVWGDKILTQTPWAS